MAEATMIMRALAAELVNAHADGIAAYVQERVHSTSIGYEATWTFLLQLCQELEHGINEFINEDEELQLTHEQEVELGTLLSASSSSIRYVTERDAMTKLLPRFRHAFQSVLMHPSWHSSLMGLKMVALGATTRVLEAFGDHVASEDVQSELQWLLMMFEPTTIHSAHMQYLFRPTCEFINVAYQTHGSIVSQSNVVSQWLQLVPVVENMKISPAIQNEQVTMLAVFLQTKHHCRSVWTLLSMPSFIHQDQEDEEEEDAKPLNPHLPVDIMQSAIDVLVLWLSCPVKRVATATLLARMCAHSTLLLPSIANAMAQSLNDLQLTTVQDFEFVHVVCECLRDMALSCPLKQEDATPQCIYDALVHVLPMLETAFKSGQIAKSHLRVIKTTCVAIRSTVTEALVAWLHTAPVSIVAQQSDEILASKLSDPGLYGDLLHQLRQNPMTQDVYNAILEQAALKLVRATQQLDRYSSDVGNRIVTAIARLAVATGPDIQSFAAALVSPLKDAVETTRGTALRVRLEAIGSLVLACADHEDALWKEECLMALCAHAWKENVHALVILNGLLANPLLQKHTADICIKDTEACEAFFVHAFSRWPLYEEDEEMVALELELLSRVRSSVWTSAIQEAITTLYKHTAQDHMDELAVLCKPFTDIIP